jgi:hypothetical protein
MFNAPGHPTKQIDRRQNSMTKTFILTILFFCYIILPSQTIRGKVIDYETGDKEEDVEIVLRVNDSVKYYTKTDGKGKFIFKNIPPGNYNLLAFQTGRTAEQISNINPINSNDFVIMLHQQTIGIIICTETIKFVCEEDNPSFEYVINSKNTINFLDSLGRKQGLWTYGYDRHTQPKSKYRQNSLICKGYYKNDKKIGRWIYVKPNGHVSEIVTYQNDHIISRTKHCAAH